MNLKLNEPRKLKLKGRRERDESEVERTKKVEIKKTNFSAAEEPCKAIFFPTSGLQGRTIASSGFLGEGAPFNFCVRSNPPAGCFGRRISPKHCLQITLFRVSERPQLSPKTKRKLNLSGCCERKTIVPK